MNDRRPWEREILDGRLRKDQVVIYLKMAIIPKRVAAPSKNLASSQSHCHLGSGQFLWGVVGAGSLSLPIAGWRNEIRSHYGSYDATSLINACQVSYDQIAQRSSFQILLPYFI